MNADVLATILSVVIGIALSTLVASALARMSRPRQEYDAAEWPVLDVPSVEEPGRELVLRVEDE